MSLAPFWWLPIAARLLGKAFGGWIKTADAMENFIAAAPSNFFINNCNMCHNFYGKYVNIMIKLMSHAILLEVLVHTIQI